MLCTVRCTRRRLMANGGAGSATGMITSSTTEALQARDELLHGVSTSNTHWPHPSEKKGAENHTRRFMKSLVRCFYISSGLVGRSLKNTNRPKTSTTAWRTRARLTERPPGSRYRIILQGSSAASSRWPPRRAAPLPALSA